MFGNLLLLTDADELVLVVKESGRTESNDGIIVNGVRIARVTGRCSVGAQRLAMVAAQVVDAHLHAVNAGIQPLGALVHICRSNQPPPQQHQQDSNEP